jgi:hypothetical protein
VLFTLDHVPVCSSCFAWVPQRTLARWHASYSQSLGTSFLQATIILNSLEAPWIFGVLEVCAQDATSEQSILEETLEATLCGTPQA